MKCVYQAKTVSGHVCVLAVSIFLIGFSDFRLDFLTFPTVWYIFFSFYLIVGAISYVIVLMYTLCACYLVGVHVLE
jgi:hypothetical protein